MSDIKAPNTYIHISHRQMQLWLNIFKQPDYFLFNQFASLLFVVILKIHYTHYSKTAGWDAQKKQRH